MIAKLVSNVPAGLARNDQNELVDVDPFIGKEGTVLETNDTGYDTERPTGYEPIYYLVDFGTQKLWLPSSTYAGWDKKTDEDIFQRHLTFPVPGAS